MERELVIKVDGRGGEEDAGSILVYRLGDKVSIVPTEEEGGDAEVTLDRAATAALAEALRKVS